VIQADTSSNHSAPRSRFLIPTHTEHLLGRGLTQATINAARLWSATAEEVAQILGYDPRSGGIVIPYFHPFTGQVVLNRVRPDKPPLYDGKPAKYLSPKGAENRLYFPPGAREWTDDPSLPIGVTEGEFKALWAYQVGLRYIGLIGVYGWRGRK